jgi:hypothetical protein
MRNQDSCLPRKSEGMAEERGFSRIPDPRIERNKRHKLLDIVMIVVSAMAFREEAWDEIAERSEASGLTVSRFSRREGVPTQSPRNWVHRLAISTHARLLAARDRMGASGRRSTAALARSVDRWHRLHTRLGRRGRRGSPRE